MTLWNIGCRELSCSLPRWARAEFAARLGIVVEEADESILWLELLEDARLMAHERLESLQSEARELTALFTASQHTGRGRK